MARWLFKTEPTAYSYQQLEKDGHTVWDGVKNALALKHLKTVAKGDEVFIYHTGEEKSVVGIARVARGAYPDPGKNDLRLFVVDLVPSRALRQSVPLATMRTNPRLSKFELLRLPRLSVMPVAATVWAEILRMAGRP